MLNDSNKHSTVILNNRYVTCMFHVSSISCLTHVRKVSHIISLTIFPYLHGIVLR